MINAADMVEELRSLGVRTVSGVPCTIFKRFIKELERNTAIEYLPAPREDAAVGIAAGVFLAGGLPVIVMQNSGVGTAWTSLASLNIIYDIPALLFISWRGRQGRDAPEHLVMGRAMPDLLGSLGIDQQIIDEDNWREQLHETIDTILTKSRPVALLVPDGAI